ncbi:uncharacterized protein LOC131882756 [Tigriopus californicus]|uniref:uncharacterized protein LOC131882756 n=1 Tax=Tigriopus californicus TaxID=6832 RepID=UPI0027DA8ECF|nr:uncharacterized protein LOC131882756 [Tigriopus californicus]
MDNPGKRDEAKLSTGSNASNVSSNESDSGLSGLDDTQSLSIASTSTRDASKSPVPMKQRMDSVSLVDSGRRTQSLEGLSDDLASIQLSPGPRRRGKAEKHAHFADELERSRGVSSPALSAPPTMRNIVLPDPPRLKKSSSIPVHLTVSRYESSALPYALRPDPFCDARRSHDPDCATQQGNHNTHGTCPRAANIMDSEYSGTRGKMDWKSAPVVGGKLVSRRTAVAASAVHKSKAHSVDGRVRSPLMDIDPTHNSRRSSISSVTPSTHRKPVKPIKPSAAPPSSHTADRNGGYMKSTKSSSNRVSQKRRALVPKAMNASMEIWEIQRELKRGEMVQGVLKIGRPRQDEEPCICAPVMIGRADGHMHWRSM